jgi:hypothetical protein
MSKVHSKILLVEGKEDLRFVPEIIEANGVKWEKPYPVFIDDLDGYENFVKPDEIATYLKSSGLEILGIMIDADDNLKDRWKSIRNVLLQSISDIPPELPEDGLIHTAPDGINIGVWIMPDNQISGMLETFLQYLIPFDREHLWQLSQTVTQQAHQQGAPFTAAHQDKANIHTWLAWQDPPGRQLHQAVKERILDPKHPKAQIFVNWFKTLYNID